MIAEDFGVFFLLATLLAIAATTATKSGHLRRSTAKEHHPGDLRAFKNCPNCADPLPLSTLVCDVCEYNFLSASIGPRHKLLPAPDAARVSA